MSNRENSNDPSSQSGKSYPVGGGAQSTAPAVKNQNMTLDISKSNNLSNRVFNGHVVQVYADGAVWDTISNSYLYPTRDFNPGDIQRT